MFGGTTVFLCLKENIIRVNNRITNSHAVKRSKESTGIERNSGFNTQTRLLMPSDCSICNTKETISKL